MINYFVLTYEAISNPLFLLTIIVFSFIIKIFFIGKLLPHGFDNKTIFAPWLLLIGTLAGSMFGDFAWGMKLVREIWIPTSSYAPVTFFIRIAWAFLVLQYQLLVLFIQSLTQKKFTIPRIQGIQIIVSMIFACYFSWLAFFDNTLIDEQTREMAYEPGSQPLEITIMRYVIFYLLLFVVIPSFYSATRKTKEKAIPKIIKKQLKIFITFLLGPYLMVEFLQAAYFHFKGIYPYLYPAVALSTILLIYATYYCMKRVMGLRIFNIKQHVASEKKREIINDFKYVLQQFSQVITPHELSHITQDFFKELFHIPIRNTALYIRNLTTIEEEKHCINQTETLIEDFLSTHSINVCMTMKKKHILFYDEIAFDNFYYENETNKALLTFLETIQADVFIQLYEKDTLVGYIVISKNTRSEECFTDVERDEMLIFSSYLGSIINLIKNKNIEDLLLHEKNLQEAILQKHQEINLYKESINSFLRLNKPKQVGIIFYKQRHFTLANQTAKELVQVDLNVEEGHPLTKALKTIAMNVESYKTPQAILAKDTLGNMFSINGVPHLERNTVILTISHPDITDIVTKQYDYIENPHDWDYILYLEATETGKLIQQLFPGSGNTLLHFKIQLLKAITTQKALLIDGPDEDIEPIVKLLHHVSNREKLHSLVIKTKPQNYQVAATLFGINPILGIETAENTPLLEKLHNNGTLYIQNVDRLSYEAQEYLAEYLRFGYYRKFKSEQKIESDVYILCSSRQNLFQLAQEHRFSHNLYGILKQNTLVVPSLITLPETELVQLIDGFSEQAVKDSPLHQLLNLTDKEKKRFLLKRPTSLQELKTKVRQLLIQKSKKQNIAPEETFDPAYSVHDPELIEAARLGRQALKDRRIMVMLWNKFKNQNKIATLLGVNRSSVNRRCKEYNLL